MRPAALLLSFGVLLSSCSRSYWVRPEHLEKARQMRREGGEDVALAARDRAGDDTYLDLDSVEAAWEPDPRSGLQVVETTDMRPPARIVGWVLGGIGLLALTASAGEWDRDDKPVVEGMIFAGFGTLLLVYGYGTSGPEADAPSEGLPASVETGLHDPIGPDR